MMNRPQIVIHFWCNTPIRYTAISHGFKNGYFQMKTCESFLDFAQNIDCGYMYTLEPPL